MRTALLDGIGADDVAWLAGLLRGRSGVGLAGPAQAEERLAPLLWRRHVSGFRALMALLREEPDGLLAVEALDRLANAGNWFFRDAHPFQLLRTQVLPALVHAAQGRPLRCWAACCGAGQEAYSLALCIRHYVPLLQHSIPEIWGTDPSECALSRARAAVYDRDEMSHGLPLALVVRYFELQGIRWQIKDEIRGLVRFQTLALVEPWSGLPDMDLILLRNALAGLDHSERDGLLRRAQAQLAPGGWLVLEPHEDAGPTPGLRKVDTPYGAAWQSI